MKKVVSLKKALLLPLFLALTFIISFSLFLAINMENRFSKQYLKQEFVSSQQLLTSSIEIETKKLEGFLELLSQNTSLKQAMRNDDKNRLLALAERNFNSLKKHHVSHFYFHQPNLVNYLRVHQPQRFGDQINRKSALDASKSRKTSWAIEIGPLGLFTLRVVMPWYDKGELVGYLELGEEIEHIYKHVHKSSTIGLFITVSKSMLEHSGWKAGNQVIGRERDWAVLPDSAVAFSSLTSNHNDFALSLSQATKAQQTYQPITVKDLTYQTLSVAIPDANNPQDTIGHMVFFKDISEIKNDSQIHLWSVISSGAFVSILLMLLFYQMIIRVEKKIRSANSLLESSEERFRHLVENSTDWIWEVDQQGRYVYSSPKIIDILGYQPEEMLGKTPFDFMPDIEAQQIKKVFTDYIKACKPFIELENINLHKNGSPVILETNGTPIFDENQQLIGYRGVDRDITQRKQHETALNEMSQKVLLHVEKTPLGAIEWNTDFQVISWNPAAEKIFGYTKAEALHKTAEELILTTNDKGHVFDIWSKLMLNQSRGFSSTNENITQDGRTITCRWYNTPLVDKYGKVIEVASFVEDITEQQKAQEKISFMAYYDGLTGLANRVLFKDRLKQSMLHADRNNTSLSVLFLDIDHFKSINDTFGHQVGDLMLREVSARLQTLTRTQDTIARFGGDEFIIILNDLKLEKDIQRIIGSILEEFEAPINLNGNNLFIRLSIGSVIYPKDGNTIEDLLRNADTAMYYAKENGRNHHQKYHKKMTENVRQRLTIETDLHDAVENDEFELYYQPQVDAMNEELIGVEALIRWNHPSKGLISPGEFIGVAESSGLIIPMGRWVYETACKQLKAWQEQGLTSITMAINFSPIQFRQQGLVDEFMEFVVQLNLDQNMVELELTENQLIENSNHLLKELNKLSHAGFQLAIDDFGTGYSALSYLNKFPMTKLKIDQAFVRDLFVDESHQSLVKAIIAMAKALNIKTIAEGVETPQQLEFLRHEGCKQIQGYYFGKPMPAGEILERFSKK